MTAPRRPHPAQLTTAVGVGTVDHRSARIWMRAPGAGAGQLTLVLISPEGSDLHCAIAAGSDPGADHTLVVTYPDDFPGAAPLRPLARYQFRVQAADGRLVGEGRFETAPAGPEDTPERFCFAFTSCHQPFSRDGSADQHALAMLRAAQRTLVAHDAKFLLLIGDQVYADEPPPYSIHGPEQRDDRLRSALLSASLPEIRRRYHEQYRRSWAVPGFLSLQAERSTHCMPDDHEIVDNWGSVPEHADMPWQRVAGGALDAFFDYQGARSWPAGTRRPPHVGRWFAYGTIAVCLLDVRSERQAVPGHEQVISEAQMQLLTGFLQANRHRDALFVVIGVPIVHIPGLLNKVGEKLVQRGSDLHDRWSHPPLIPQRDRILSLLAAHRQAHPQQQMALLSGDIHAGWGATLRPPGGEPLAQFTSSALTNHDASMAGAVARVLLELTRPLEREVAGLLVAEVAAEPGSTNPYGGLNLGIVEIQRVPGGRAQIRFKLIGQDGEDRSQPKVVFSSILRDG